MVKVVRKLQPSTVYMGRFEYGSDIITTLEQFCAQEQIRHAWVQILGALSEATICYYEQEGHQYITRQLSGEYEIVSCIGNISTKDGKPFGHLHITLTDTQFQALGGHLMPGTVKLFAGEFLLQAFDKTVPDDSDLQRCPDEKTGLALW